MSSTLVRASVCTLHVSRTPLTSHWKIFQGPPATLGKWLPPFLPGGLGLPMWPQSHGWVSSSGCGCRAQRVGFINERFSWKKSDSHSPSSHLEGQGHTSSHSVNSKACRCGTVGRAPLMPTFLHLLALHLWAHPVSSDYKVCAGST